VKFSINAAKANFFDRDKIINAVDKATRAVLAKFGAFVRQTAKKSIRKRKKSSDPGKPPSSHTGLLKKFIFFAYDTQSKSVVIGPAQLNSVVDSRALPALEYGGLATIQERRGGLLREIPIKARPFMRPAFELEKPGLPAMWKDSVR
jgi:hypothetical protein